MLFFTVSLSLVTVDQNRLLLPLVLTLGQLGHSTGALPAVTDEEDPLCVPHALTAQGLGKTYDEFSVSAVVVDTSRRPGVGRKGGQRPAQKD